MKIKTCLLASFILAALPTVLFAQRSVGWKFNQGDEYTVTMDQQTTINSKMDQRAKDVKSTLVLTLDWQVTSIDDSTGNGTINQTISRIQLDMLSRPTGATKPIKIDTGDKATKRGFEAKLLKQVKPLVGASFQVVMSPRGEIMEVTIPEETLETLRSVPGSMRLRQLLTSDGLKDLYGQSAIVLPDQALEADVTWSKSANVKTELGEFEKQHDYRWKGQRDDRGVSYGDIVGKTTLTPNKDSLPSDTTFVGFDGAESFVMNLSEGHLVSSDISNQMKTNKSYREKVIETTIDTRILMKIEKKK